MQPQSVESSSSSGAVVPSSRPRSISPPAPAPASVEEPSSDVEREARRVEDERREAEEKEAAEAAPIAPSARISPPPLPLPPPVINLPQPILADVHPSRSPRAVEAEAEARPVVVQAGGAAAVVIPGGGGAEVVPEEKAERPVVQAAAEAEPEEHKAGEAVVVVEHAHNGESTEDEMEVDHVSGDEEKKEEEEEEKKDAPAPPPRPPPPSSPSPPPEVRRPVGMGKVPRDSGVGVGKHGRGKGAFAPKRHQAVRRRILRGDAVSGVLTKPALCRLARRGGIMRISESIQDAAKEALKSFLEDTVRRAVVYMEYARRKTVTAMDMVYALKGVGHRLYGFEEGAIGRPP